MQKIRLFHWFVLEIWVSKKSCNLSFLAEKLFGKITGNFFSQIWYFCTNTANNINIEQIQKRLMTKFFNKFKKPCFQPIFGTFSKFQVQKIFFLQNKPLSDTTSYGLLTTYQFLEKTNDTFLENSCTDGRIESQIIFYKTLLAIAGVQIN